MNYSTWPALLVVDVEGNGTNPPDLVEVAALPVVNGAPDTGTAGAWLIRPPRPVTPFAAQVHGLTNETLASCPSWQEVAGQVRGLLGGAWIAAHNAHVDYRVLSAHLPNWRPAGVIDTLRLARAVWPGLPSYASGRSSRFCCHESTVSSDGVCVAFLHRRQGVVGWGQGTSVSTGEV